MNHLIPINLNLFKVFGFFNQFLIFFYWNNFSLQIIHLVYNLDTDHQVSFYPYDNLVQIFHL
jgi:hypothetical protein